MEIFAIGHSNYPYEKFINMIKKYNIQYNKEYLSERLKNDGYLYIYN